MRLTHEFRPYRFVFTNGARRAWYDPIISLGQIKVPLWLYKMPFVHTYARSKEWSVHIVLWKFSLYVDTPDLDEIQVCPHCFNEVIHIGDDGIDYCTNGCGCIEGDQSCYTTLREFENRA